MQLEHLRVPSTGSKPWSRFHSSWQVMRAILALSYIPLLVAAAENQERNAQLEFGFTNHTFYGVNESDAQGAFKIFVGSLGKTRGYQLDVKTHIFDDISEFGSYINSRKLQLIAIPAWDFMSLDIDAIMEPLFVSKVNGRVKKDYLLLVRRDSEFHELESLRSKSINIMRSTGIRLSQIWIDELLNEKGLELSDQFFQTKKEIEKVALAILPVFFGKIDACIVNRAGFEMMTELNPQIGKNLRILASSVSYLESIICVSRSDWEDPSYRQDAILALEQLHNEVEGKQILTLFRIDQLAPYEPSYLETLRELRDGDRKEDAGPASTTPTSR